MPSRRALVATALVASALVALVWQRSRDVPNWLGGNDGRIQAEEPDVSTEDLRQVDGWPADGTGEGTSRLLDVGMGSEGYLDQDTRDLVSRLVSSGELAVTVEEGDVQQAAQRLLATYQGKGGCALGEAGYLDLLGSVWGCVVGGGQWVDVCLVSDMGDGSSRVTVLHLDAGEVAEELLEVGTNDGRGS